MSTQKTFGRHAQSKTPRALPRVSAAVTVTGGLVAGLAATGGSPAGAAPTTPQQEAVKAATTPLELKTVTPAKSLVAKQATAAAATKKSTVKKTSRTQARQALTQRDERATQTLAVQRKAAQERREARAAAKATQERREARAAVAKERQERQQRTQVSRTQVRLAVTQQQTPRQQVRQTQAPRMQQAVQQQPRQRNAATATTQRTRQYTVNTASTRTTTKKAAAATPSRAGVVGIASQYTGIRYTFGGSTPATGLDCSGFVALVFKQVGVNLPHSSGAIKAMTTPVSNPRPGDLVFLPGHVGIYAGNGKVYEARNYGSPSGLYPVLPGATYGRL